eukprot:365319-Chlamydomonas_euryale.AAC.9
MRSKRRSARGVEQGMGIRPKKAPSISFGLRGSCRLSGRAKRLGKLGPSDPAWQRHLQLLGAGEVQTALAVEGGCQRRVGCHRAAGLDRGGFRDKQGNMEERCDNIQTLFTALIHKLINEHSLLA